MHDESAVNIKEIFYLVLPRNEESLKLDKQIYQSYGL